jgi:division protein CdvB (Snf7/Vps24/ESCRT-III family)
VATARVQENLDAIQQFWEEAGKTGADPLTWASGEANRDSTNFDADIKKIGKLQAAYSRLREYPHRIDTAKKNLQTAIASQGEAQKK